MTTDHEIGVQWTGENLLEVQGFVGFMENMDGDVRTCRFLEPEALNDDGQRIWDDPRARLWTAEIRQWVPVDPWDWIVQRADGAPSYRLDQLGASQ